MGDVCMIPQGLKCCLGQRQVLLRPNPKRINPYYLFYSLQSPTVQKQILWNEGTGSTVSNLRIPNLKCLEIPILDSQTQNYIGETLGAIDEKIELNLQMNATLECIAQAIFKQLNESDEKVHLKSYIELNPRLSMALLHKGRRQTWYA